MHRRIHFPATVVCLSALLLLGFSGHADETTSSSPDLLAAMQGPGTVTVTGQVLYPNRVASMREAWGVRVRLYVFSGTTMSPQTVWLATTYTDGAGVFRFDSITNYDQWDSLDPDRRLDLFIVVEAYAFESGVSYSKVAQMNGSTYKWNEGCPGCTIVGLWWNVPDGSVTMDYSIDPLDPNRPAMWLLRDAQRSWDYVNTATWSDPGSTNLAWQKDKNCYLPALPGVNSCASFFYALSPGPFAFIQDIVRNSSDTVVHEIGHNYMYNVTQSHTWYTGCPNHDIWTSAEGTGQCGWSEGWADFFPLLVNGDRCYDRLAGPCTGIKDQDYYDLENQGWSDGKSTGPTVEGRVAGALYDLYDSNNEGPFDVATNSFESMWTIMRDRSPSAQTLRDFGDSWKNTGYAYAPFLLVSYQNTIDYGARWTYLPLIMK